MTNKIYTIDEIKQLSNQVFRQYPMIKEAYLFGSYARKEADEQSDLDFIIVLDSYDTLLFHQLYILHFQKDLF